MNWEHEKAKKDLVEFLDYAHELYGDGEMDAEDKAKLAAIEKALGADGVKAIRTGWKPKASPINRSQIPRGSVVTEDKERTASAPKKPEVKKGK